MTGLNTTREHKVPASALYPEAVASFEAIGWTAAQWDDLYHRFTSPPLYSPGVVGVAAWLRTPHTTFYRTTAPASVRDLHAAYGMMTASILSVVTDCGASPRFAATFMERLGTINGDRTVYARDGWTFACSIGLSEDQATGWAATGYLRPSGPTLTRPQMGALINAWTGRFGPTAFLYVLAGITLDEAVHLKESGATPAEQPLRVMVALAGHVLPPGI